MKTSEERKQITKVGRRVDKFIFRYMKVMTFFLFSTKNDVFSFTVKSMICSYKAYVIVNIKREKRK